MMKMKMNSKKAEMLICNKMPKYFAEDFKEIPGFPGYFIAENGKVWSAPKNHRKEGLFLSSVLNLCGYRQVTLYRDKKYFLKEIPCLLLETFVGSCLEGMELKHRDGDRQNDNLKNLCWSIEGDNAEMETIKTKVPTTYEEFSEALSTGVVKPSALAKSLSFGDQWEWFSKLSAEEQARRYDGILSSKRQGLLKQRCPVKQDFVSFKEIKEIRRLYDNKELNQLQLAAKFNVDVFYINQIVRRRRGNVYFGKTREK